MNGDVLLMLLEALRGEQATACALVDRLKEAGADPEADRLRRLLGLAGQLRLLRDEQDELVERLRLDDEGDERDLDGAELEELCREEGKLAGLIRALELLEPELPTQQQEEDDQPCGYFCCGACYGACDGNHTGECCTGED